MFAVGDISRFESEKSTCKILKPVWDVTTDYLLLFLAMLSMAFAGMQVTSGSFQCLAAVDCPGISRSNMSSSLLSHIKYDNACKAFYSSQKANVIRRTDVVTDLKSSFPYINFVNSECSKSAIPNFLAYFWFVLFIEAFVLLVLDNLWLKLPNTASVIEHFVSLVMECYASPCPDWTLTQALADLPTTHNEDDQQRDENINVLKDPATISSIKALCEKVHALEENVTSSDKFVKIWQLYLIQSISQVSFAIIFFVVDIYYVKDLQETMTCTLTQHIPVTHAYFICSHGLAPAFALGLKWLYLPTLGLALAIFIFIITWTFSRKGKYNFQYVFEMKLPHMVGITLKNFSAAANEDFGFLLHLLHSYNKLYATRFAHFAANKSKKKIQAYWLKKMYTVSHLEKQLKENGNGNELRFNDIPGIPETIFNLSSKIRTLIFVECRLENDDFEKFFELISLRKLYIIKCGLKSIPKGILKIECLEVLNLRGNFIAEVNRIISKLQNLTTLDLSDNNLETLNGESYGNLDNLREVYLFGNPKLQMSVLKFVLKCENVRVLDPPRHLSYRKHELNQMERVKFDDVSFRVIPYTPEDAPHIDLEAHETNHKMNSCPKGMAIIISNHSYQTTAAHPDREGSERDVSALKSLFEQIGFVTVCCINYKAGQAKKFLEVCAENIMYKECDSIAVAIMSHGSEDDLYFPDGKVLPVMELVKSVQKSSLYQGKPKLFFVQAFRGAQHSGGNTVHFIPHNAVADAVLPSAGNREKLTTDALPRVMIQPPSLPGADILLSYSIMDGFVSLRNSSSGSWYVQALVETFYKHACEEDILSLHTLVNYEVVRVLSPSEWRQVPAPQSTLTKKLYLLPGYPPQ